MVDLLHHLDGGFLYLRTKGLSDEDLAERFAQVAINIRNAALPAWPIGLHAAQILAVEIEVGLHEWRREIRSARLYQMPAQIILPIGQRFRREQRGQLLVELRLG